MINGHNLIFGVIGGAKEVGPPIEVGPSILVV
jgi:hypothetical protein